MTDQPRRARPYTKSSRSGGSGGNCVEWACEAQGVYIRDSKHPTGPELFASHSEWDAFAAAAGEDREHPWITRSSSGVRVRKDRQELQFTTAEWEAFAAGVNAGECVPTGV